MSTANFYLPDYIDHIIHSIEAGIANLLNELTVENIMSWFIYDPKNPMLFSSALFLGFFLFFYTVYVLTKKHEHFRIIYVILFSLFFYYKAGGIYFLLILGSGIVNYYLAEFMHKQQDAGKRKLYITLIVIGNLLVLGYYKYTNFIIDNINSLLNGNYFWLAMCLLFVNIIYISTWKQYKSTTAQLLSLLVLLIANGAIIQYYGNFSFVFDQLNFPPHVDLHFQKILLPIGISFFTFQAISYAVDLYRREIQPAKNVLDFSFFICFFPQIVAGPIVRAKDFIPQMYEKLHLTKQQASGAVFMILIGLIKKAIISDYISGNFVDRVFDAPMSYTAFENLMATYGYALQIYCDFSGYSDMAIGLALLMGFTLPLNFDTPYKSQSVTEFWRRWHISLSSWLRDYLYIPLGGNRSGKVRTYVNLFLTMLIGGLWHGASWKFVVWGGLHGFMLGVERFVKQYIKIPENRFTRVVCILLTFHFVAFCWIFFRADSFDTAGNVISNIAKLTFSPNEWLVVLNGYKNVFILVAIGYFLHFLPEKFVNWVKTGFDKIPLVFKGVIAGFIIWLVYATASSGPQPFIYFQF